MAISIGPGISIGSGISLLADPPIPSGSANFVNASNQYLSATSVSVGTTQSTYEWWFYLNSLPTTSYGMFNNRGTGGTAATGFNVYLDNASFIHFVSSSTADASFFYGVTANTWYHIAFQRGTLNWNCYINGVSTGLAQSSTTTAATMLIGRDPFSTTKTFDGYISNFRYVKGVRVYTGNFTVPTSPLQATQSAGANISAVTGTQTQLLLNTVNGSNFLQDSSTFNITVTNNNGVTSNALNPFGS